MVWRHKVPSWVPTDVRFLVYDFWANWPRSSQEIEIIQRLLIDPRMEAVWQELLRKDRRTGDYKYVCQSMKRKLGNVRANEVFPASTAIVFRAAFGVGISAQQFRKQKSMYYFEQAHGRRGDAKFLRRMIKERRLENVSIDEVYKLARDLDKAADAYDRLSGLAGLRFVGSGLFDNPQLVNKGFAVTMAETMRRLYGSPLYGTVTTIAQVALDDDGITTAAVRAWCTLTSREEKTA